MERTYNDLKRCCGEPPYVRMDTGNQGKSIMVTAYCRSAACLNKVSLTRSREWADALRLLVFDTWDAMLSMEPPKQQQGKEDRKRELRKRLREKK